MEGNEFEKSRVFSIQDILEYVDHSVVIKTIITKATGNVSAFAFDSGETLTGKVSPFNTFIHVIDGKAEIIINDVSNLLVTGQSIIIPSHSKNTIKAHVRFKMLSTFIKSGYEELA